MNEITQAISGSPVIILLMLILIVILAFITFSMSMRLSRTLKKYESFMKGKDGASLEGALRAGSDQIEDIREQNNSNEFELKRLKNQLKSTFTRYGIVKYDAFDDMGGKMSFALAMLDDENTGIILNSVHSQDNCFLYIKEIVKGESYIMLSSEEVEALKRAANKFETEEL